jgi:hypothetical protein
MTPHEPLVSVRAVGNRGKSRTVDDVLASRHPSKEDNLHPQSLAFVVGVRTELLDAPEDEVLVVKDDGCVVFVEVAHCSKNFWVCPAPPPSKDFFERLTNQWHEQMSSTDQ